jgi:hypothetical protein
LLGWTDCARPDSERPKAMGGASNKSRLFMGTSCTNVKADTVSLYLKDSSDSGVSWVTDAIAY